VGKQKTIQMLIAAVCVLSSSVFTPSTFKRKRKTTIPADEEERKK
jgi:hypothetical protein